VQLFLQLNLAAPADPMTGTVGDTNWSANVTAYPKSMSPHQPATAWAGTYTMLFPPDTTALRSCRYGYGLGTIGPNGGLNI